MAEPSKTPKWGENNMKRLKNWLQRTEKHKRLDDWSTLFLVDETTIKGWNSALFITTLVSRNRYCRQSHLHPHYWNYMPGSIVTYYRATCPVHEQIWSLDIIVVFQGSAIPGNRRATTGSILRSTHNSSKDDKIKLSPKQSKTTKRCVSS